VQQQREIYQSKYETLLNVAQLGGWEYDVLTQEITDNFTIMQKEFEKIKRQVI